MSAGSIYKRCRCRGEDSRELARCPKLYRPGGAYSPTHGTWYFKIDVGAPGGKRKTIRRGGFDTKREAQAALDEIRGRAAKGVDVGRRLTVRQYLDEWVASKSRSYQQHVRDLWVPQLGGLDLTALRRAHVQAALDTLTVSAATKVRYKATLSKGLSDAVREGLVTVNVAKLVTVKAERPEALVWTAARVVEWTAELELRRADALRRSRGRPIPEFKLWHDTGSRPSPVMVWTPEQVGRFLDHASDHPLYALFHLVALRGLRRGEAAGLRRQDLDLDAGKIHIRHQIRHSGEAVDVTKSKAGKREVTLDAGTVEVLREHLQRQAEQRAYVGTGWTQTPYVFTNEDGTMLSPGAVTRAFEKLAFKAGLPPVRFHDLRHGAASIMNRAGVDMVTISKTLGHSTVQITQDLYTSTFEDADRAAAEAAAAVVPRAVRS